MQHTAALREQLQAEAQGLRGRLLKIRGDLRQKDGALSPDFEEQAVELENSEVLAALEDRTQEKLSEIEHALIQIDQGGYGICENCGATIHPKRLHAIPTAKLCIKCAEESEKATLHESFQGSFLPDEES